MMHLAVHVAAIQICCIPGPEVLYLFLCTNKSSDKYLSG